MSHLTEQSAPKNIIIKCLFFLTFIVFFDILETEFPKYWELWNNHFHNGI